jgi:hypothetical protein
VGILGMRKGTEFMFPYLSDRSRWPHTVVSAITKLDGCGHQISYFRGLLMRPILVVPWKTLGRILQSTRDPEFCCPTAAALD